MACLTKRTGSARRPVMRSYPSVRMGDLVRGCTLGIARPHQEFVFAEFLDFNRRRHRFDPPPRTPTVGV